MKRTKQVLWLGIALVIAIGLATYTQAQNEVDKGEEVITLNAEGKKPAIFPHWAHQERLECAFCHEDERFPTEWNKDTGHATCKECHAKTDAPTKCSTCHPKTKKSYEGC